MQIRKLRIQNSLDWGRKKHPSYQKKTKSVYEGFQVLKKPTMVKKKDRVSEKKDS